MKRLAHIICICFALSCTDKKPDNKAEAEKLMQLSKEWSKAAGSGDIEKTVSYWDEDAILMSAGQPTLKGKHAIRQMVEESFKIPGFHISWEPLSVEISENGDMAYLIERSQVEMKDSTGKTLMHHNKAVTIWRKQADGSWKNVVDISTPDSTESK